MKNRKNVKRYYAMSIVDGRTAIATRELLTNPDYRIVSEEVARKVERKILDWRKVAFELRQRDSMNPAELIKRAEQEKVKNLRVSPVTRENVEQFETQISETEVGEVYDAPADGEEAPQPPKNKSRGRGRNRETPDESDGEKADGDAAEDLDI